MSGTSTCGGGAGSDKTDSRELERPTRGREEEKKRGEVAGKPRALEGREERKRVEKWGRKQRIRVK
jgi:hypothetical protein